ncbi:MAG TPA: DUF58 domain-containing protein [Gaiellaceae bacterium]|nr:DUF58 domain-containing protein [Gaiellaceae bacterium]
MIRRASPKLVAYANLSAVGLLTALVLGRPELVALAAPFLVALGAGLVLASPPRFSAELSADERVVEGDLIEARLAVAAATSVARLDVYLRVPEGLEAGGEQGTARAISLRRGETRDLDFELTARLWGAHALGPLYLRARDPLGLVSWEGMLARTPSVRVYPKEDTLRRIVHPRDTQVFSGSEVARRKGEGIEFADVRPWTSGDAVKRVNWRATARRGELWVNESHPERNTDVILFVDSFADARQAGAGTLDLAVRATAALADAYIHRRDRVGLVSFGGILRWLLPGMGTVQLYRIIDALLDTEVILSYYWTEIDVLPRRTLPPNALVVALSPLLDRRFVGALLDLRARGVDLAVVDISPLPFTTRPAGGLDAVAYDIWTLRRDALRHRLQQAGVAVAEWREDAPLQAVLEEVRSFRRYARAAHV